MPSAEDRRRALTTHLRAPPPRVLDRMLYLEDVLDQKGLVEAARAPYNEEYRRLLELHAQPPRVLL